MCNGETILIVYVQIRYPTNRGVFSRMRKQSIPGRFSACVSALGTKLELTPTSQMRQVARRLTAGGVSHVLHILSYRYHIIVALYDVSLAPSRPTHKEKVAIDAKLGPDDVISGCCVQSISHRASPDARAT